MIETKEGYKALENNLIKRSVFTDLLQTHLKELRKHDTNRDHMIEESISNCKYPINIVFKRSNTILIVFHIPTLYTKYVENKRNHYKIHENYVLKFNDCFASMVGDLSTNVIIFLRIKYLINSFFFNIPTFHVLPYTISNICFGSINLDIIQKEKECAIIRLFETVNIASLGKFVYPSSGDLVNKEKFEKLASCINGRNFLDTDVFLPYKNIKETIEGIS